MGCCNKRKKKAQQIDKKDNLINNNIEKVKVVIGNMIYDVDIDNDSFDLNDNFPIEPEKDKNLSLPFDSYNLEFVFGKDYLYKYKNF